MDPLPQTTSHWTLQPNGGLPSLQLHTRVPIPPLKPDECLVSITAITLNHRDVAIPNGTYPLSSKADLIPCSDASGHVLAVGSSVHEFRVGDKVCTVFNPSNQTSPILNSQRKSALGSLADGVLRKHMVVPALGLVRAPDGLSAREAASLPCAAVTAYNSLFGLEGRRLEAGQSVLAQGTGGVSVFALQFAKAAGAKVFVTASSKEKEGFLRTLGAEGAVDYRRNADWGRMIKELTDDGEGVHHVVEVGGEASMTQSLEAVRCEGVVSVVGFLGGSDGAGDRKSGFGDCLRTLAIVRGVNVGSRELFVEMNEFIARHTIRPVLDPSKFGFEDAPKAFQHLWDAKHTGKLVIDVDESD